MSKVVKYASIAIIVVVIVALIAGSFAFQKIGNNSNGISVSNLSNTNDLSIEYSSAELLGEYTDYTAKIDLNEMSIVEGGGLYISDTTIEISKSGTYYFSGKTEEGNIVVNADNQEVVIVLDNVELACSTKSAIEVVDAKKVTINIPKGSTSTLTDCEKYTEFTEDDEPNATVFSKDDLTIDGKGTLIINSKYEDAIASKDGLKIVGTTLKINSVDDGIRGKDYVTIKDATIEITSKGKGIKATEDSDEKLGFVVIDGGTILINSKDDAIHSNNAITINDGILTLSAEDDGIHADNTLVINGGEIQITKSYEGIEGTYIEINGGTLDIISNDDGINICGGNDSFGMMKQDNFRSQSSDDTNRMLVINGGTIRVEANGDGLDSNGSIKMTGGTVIVGGSTNGGNSALDYNNSCEISGGTMIAYGPTGMWQNPSSSSTQCSIAFQVAGKKGDKVVLKDSNENVITEISPERDYGIICISTEGLKQGETYKLIVNDEEVGTQELTSIVTSNGNSGGMFGGFGQGRSKGDFQKGEKQNFGEEFPEDFPFRDEMKGQNDERIEMPEMNGKGKKEFDKKKEQILKDSNNVI